MASPCVLGVILKPWLFLFFSLALSFCFFFKLIFLYEYVCDICNKCLVIICFMASWSSLHSSEDASVSEKGQLCWVMALPSCCSSYVATVGFIPQTEAACFKGLILLDGEFPFTALAIWSPLPCNSYLYLVPSLSHLSHSDTCHSFS